MRLFASEARIGRLAKEQYKLSMGMIGLVLIEAHERDEANEKPLGEYVKEYTRQLAPVLMYLVRDIATIV